MGFSEIFAYLGTPRAVYLTVKIWQRSVSANKVDVGVTTRMLFGDARAALGGGGRNANLVSVRLKRAHRKSGNPLNHSSGEQSDPESPHGRSSSAGRSSFFGKRGSTNLKDLLERPSIDLSLPDVDDEVNSIAESEHKFLGNSISETFNLNRKWLQRWARFGTFYAVGVGIFMHLEGWSFEDSFWFVTQTISTVGYGNLAPKTVSGRIFDIFYLLVGILLTFSVIGDVTHNIVKFMRRKYSLPPKLNKLQLIVRHSINLIMWIFIMFSVFFFGAIVFAYNENWSFSQALYFAVVTCSSVGYGDVVPKNQSSIWFNCFFILAGVSTTALAFEKVSSFKRHLDCAELDQILGEIELSPELLNAIDRTGRQRVSRAEYVLHMLQLAGKIGATDILPWIKRFEEFDCNADGYLTKSDWLDYQSKRMSQSKSGDIAYTSPLSSESGSKHTSTQSRKKSLIMQITEETKDVLLETLKIKRTDTVTSGRITAESTKEVVVSPLKQMHMLKRASTFTDQSHDSLNLGDFELPNLDTNYDDSATTHNNEHDIEDPSVEKHSAKQQQQQSSPRRRVSPPDHTSRASLDAHFNGEEAKDQRSNPHTTISNNNNNNRDNSSSHARQLSPSPRPHHAVPAPPPPGPLPVDISNTTGSAPTSSRRPLSNAHNLHNSIGHSGGGHNSLSNHRSRNVNRGQPPLHSTGNNNSNGSSSDRSPQRTRDVETPETRSGRRRGNEDNTDDDGEEEVLQSMPFARRG